MPRKPTSATRLYLVLGLALTGAIAGALLIGAAELSERKLTAILLDLRGARLVAAFLCGAALAGGGVIVQGLFRNPLASPSILGTTAGASLGGQIAVLSATFSLGLSGTIAPEMFLPIGCLIGALISLLILLLFIRQGADSVTLLLTGFILSALFLAIASFLVSLAQESYELGRAVISFALGSVSGAGWTQVLMVAPLVVVGLMAAWLWGRPLDLMLSGSDEAASLGVDVTRVRRWTVVWVALLTGAAVSLGGNIAFVGLVVPHALRPFAGVSHRHLLPAAILAGGTFVVICDVLVRLMPSQSEIPLGVVTGLIGAPVFLTLLLRSRRAEVRGD